MAPPAKKPMACGKLSSLATCLYGILMLSLGFYGRHNVPDGSDTTKNNDESVISPPLRRNIIDDRTLFSPVTDEEFEQCVQTLKMVSDSNGEVGIDEFILFLELYSGRELFFDDFQDLPTPYVLIFYAAACSVGDGCEDLEETVSLGQLEEAGAGGVLYTLCQSVKNVSAVQLSMNYQFQVRHVGEDSIYNIMSGLDGSSIIMALQDVSEKVLMEYFGCLDSSSRSLLESRSGTRERREAILGYYNEALHRHLEPADHNTLNIRASANVCDYRANVFIKTITPSLCLSDATGGNLVPSKSKCALVSAEISVTAASLNEFRTTPDLRSEVVAALRSAFNRDLTQISLQ